MATNTKSSNDDVDLVELGKSVFANNYGPGKIAITHAEGARVTDEHGNSLIDLGTGISVTSFGTGHPQIKAALHEQVDKLWHTSNLYYNEPSIRLAEALLETCFAERVFFCNSGAEANEAAIKTVRKAASADREPERRTILTFEGGFHGRTLATVTATAQPKYHAGFEPLPTGFRYAPYNDLDALDRVFDDSICAVLLEPVQGEGGIHVAEPAFLWRLRELCDTHGAYLVLDEVQCGMGRTGKLWAHQWLDGFEPDAMTSAKALGAGLPIGALLVGKRLADTLQPGSHGSTFGGNPVSCAAARVALSLAQDPAMIANVIAQGERLRSSLESIGKEMGVIKEVRGKGLMIGVELNEDASAHLPALMDACRQHGVLVLSAGPTVLRLLPPLILSAEEVDQATAAMHAAFRETYSSFL